MPPMILTARQQWAIPNWQLPLPQANDAYDPMTASVYPIVGSLVSRSTNWARIDINENAEEVYEASYSMRVFLWAMTCVDPNGVWEDPMYDSAMRTRDDLLAIMKSAILAKPSLGKKGIVTVNEKTLTEDYLDAVKPHQDNPRWIAGGMLSFDMKMSESNYAPKIADADTVSVDAGLLTP
jgi:hypothetical protein